MKQSWFFDTLDCPRELEYYRDFEPWLPPMWKFRKLALLKPDGKMRIARIHSVNDPKENLRELIIRNLPVSQVYYSMALFLQPDRVKKRSKGDRFLGSDLAFDIDMPKIQEAREETLKLLDYLKENKYPDPEIRISGQQGYHVIINGFFKGKTEIEVLKESKKILDDVLAHGIRVDKQITADSRRVLGLVNTLHKCGNVRRIINLTELRETTELSPQFALGTVNSKGNGRMTTGNSSPPRTLQRRCADTKATRPPELGTQVLRTKGRQILVLRFPSGPSFSKHVKEKAEKHCLPHYYLFRDKEFYYLVSLVAMPKEQAKRLKGEKYLPLCEFISFTEERPTPLASKGHYECFRALGLPLPRVREFCGSSSTKVYTAKETQPLV